MNVPRHLVIGIVLILALIAFELFNFDTTRFALQSLLGEVRFAGLAWATILAVAFCAIDFAGLARLFTPQQGREEPREVWYLTGAWLLGATMNAVMTWWAVSLTLISHELGNEVLSREDLLKTVPVFIAILVWLTRILFIGAISVAGDRLLNGHERSAADPRLSGRPVRTEGYPPKRPSAMPVTKPSPVTAATTPVELASDRPIANTGSNRVRQRPPRPGTTAASQSGHNQSLRRARN
jgi:hypothetical protein